MPDLDKLATHLPDDKGYTGESPVKGGLPGFVCPRADAAGGRDGIIAPGVAAVNGLVPRGMRKIAVGDTGKSVFSSLKDGRTEADRYRAYYEASLASSGGPEARLNPVAASAASAAERKSPVRNVKRKADVIPPASAARAAHAARAGGRMIPGRRVAVDEPDLPIPKARMPRPIPEERVIADPDDPGMFSRSMEAHAGDDTLDGFYESLGGPAPGTGETDLPAERMAKSAERLAQAAAAGALADRAGRTERSDLAELAGREERVALAVGYDPDSPRTREIAGHGQTTHDALYDAMRKLADDKVVLKAHADALSKRLVELHGKLAEYAERDKHYARIEQELDEASRAETVRVQLAAGEERLKVGGQHWECRVMGALHTGRGGVSAVLTVSDVAYASELLAEIQTGRIVVLSESKRTSCTYHGHCAKIYGDPDSQDFITMFWLTVDDVESVG